MKKHNVARLLSGVTKLKKILTQKEYPSKIKVNAHNII